MERRNVKNVRIIRHLLERPDGQWTRYGLAKAAGCSRQWVIQLLRKLEPRHLVNGTKVLDRMALARYGASISPKPERVADFFIQGPVAFLKERTSEYAITTYFGEDRVTHYLFPSRCDAYVTNDQFIGLGRDILGHGLLGRGNLRLIVPADPIIIKEARDVKGTRVVALGQLMIDLVKEGAVCEEAVAEMVRRDVRPY